MKKYIELFKLNNTRFKMGQYIVEALKGKTVSGHELIVKRKDTGEKWYGSYSAAPLLDHNNNIIGVVQTMRDITGYKEAQEIRNRYMQDKIKEMERNRIARDLHDTVSQNLFSSNLFSETLQRTWEKDPKKALETLKIIIKLNSAALMDIRVLLSELMPEKTIDKDLKDLIEALLNSITEKYKIKTSFIVEGNHKISDNEKIEVYRMVQETLNNVVKHAEATTVNIYLNLHPSELKMIISDNGRGFDTNNQRAGNRYGLNIMEERARLIGATLNFESIPEKGTTITLIKNPVEEELSTA